MAHGERCPQRLYARVTSTGTAPCPVCGTIFSARLPLVRHLCDSRRRTCWDEIVAHPGRYTRLPPDELAQLDEADRVARQLSRKAGHSHVIVQGGCVKCGCTYM